MATAESVKTKILNLISLSNEATGNGDTDLTTAVNSLIAGFGQGASGGLAFDMGEFVFDADTLGDPGQNYNSAPFHALGAIPDFLLIWTDDFSDLSADNVSSYTNKAVVFVLRMAGFTGMFQRLTSANTDEKKGVSINAELSSGDYRIAPVLPNATTYTDFKRTDTQFIVPKIGSATYYRAGITYKYFVSKAWWSMEATE